MIINKNTFPKFKKQSLILFFIPSIGFKLLKITLGNAVKVRIEVDIEIKRK
ncbi:hypothetical protein JJC04_12715 [Flavobacterium covae]|nr:hypothetical protein [Flavobacterium covae]QYS90806.1 hypothetical protein JJC04_12715 [Flavobacterium covae]